VSKRDNRGKSTGFVCVLLAKKILLLAMNGTREIINPISQKVTGEKTFSVCSSTKEIPWFVEKMRGNVPQKNFAKWRVKKIRQN
jgi:hypothetical protein